MKNAIHAVALAALTATAVNARAVEIDFDDLAIGTKLSTQYDGVVFSANALVGDQYATNTDMTVVSSTGSDVIGLGKPNLVSGNVLRSYSAWLNETGDPSFRISFSDAITSFSADFAGVFTSSDVQLLAYDGSTLLGSTAGASNKAQFTLSIAGDHITSVVVVPGTLSDYVAVDDIQYMAAAVPEPSTWALSTMGLGFVAWVSRRKKHQRI